MITTARIKNAKLIQEVDKASYVGLLMMGKIKNWEEFFGPRNTDYSTYSKKQLLSGKNDVKKRLEHELNIFCKYNFENISRKNLILLYDDICANRGLECSLIDFENRYGKVKRQILSGCPEHLTVSINLWGLKFKFPEDIISKDIFTCMELFKEALNHLNPFGTKSHTELLKVKQEIVKYVRIKEFCQRSLVSSSFYLIEAYLNGIAWNHFNKIDINTISNKKSKILSDTTTVPIREKLKKYPEIIADKEFQFDDEIETFLDTIKPFRDSLVHASPFTAPEKFGGYDKLRNIYDLNETVALFSIHLVVHTIKRIREHIEDKNKSPEWLTELQNRINAFINIEKEDKNLGATPKERITINLL